jgi:integrase
MAGKKRGAGEGHIYKRADGRWEAKMRLPDGTRKSAYAKTQTEARHVLTRLTRERDLGLPILSNERLTVATFLNDWLERHSASVRHRTARRYSESLRLHVIPKLGRTPLTKLSAAQVEHLYHDLRTKPTKKNGEPLSAATVNRVHTALHAALEDAVDKGFIPRNVSDQARRPKEEKHQSRVFTPDEFYAFLDAIQGDRFEAIYLLAITTGMRAGELLGLRHSDVDLTRGVLRVAGTLGPGERGGLEVGETKTESSRRTLALVPEVVDALKRRKKEQAEERLAIGAAWPDHNLIFTRPNGQPIDGRNFPRLYFFPLLKRAGLPRLRFHELRHSAATIALHEGVPLAEVSATLGHSSQRTTLGIYSHAFVGGSAFSAGMSKVLKRRRDASHGDTGF